MQDIMKLLRHVGMSNILDKELERRKPAKRPHRKVVGAAVMDSKLLVKVIKREKAVTGIKALLVLPVAAFHCHCGGVCRDG